MDKTKEQIENEELVKAINKLRKEGLIVDVAGQYGIQTMLTAKGFEQHKILSLFIQANGTTPQPEDTKPKKSGQEKMDSAIKTMVQVGAGISQLMQGLGGLAGDPVKMDMSQAGIDLGQGRPKKKQTHKKGKPRRKKR
jgi:phage-related minor tail protein